MKRRYPLEALYRIRSDREKASASRLSLARIAERTSESALSARRREHSDYLSWCSTEADRLMESLLGKGILRADLETVKAQIAWNLSGEAAYLERTAAAETALESARRELAEATLLHQEAYLSLEKLKEHRLDWVRKVELALETAEEAELQEVAELLHQRKEMRPAA